MRELNPDGTLKDVDKLLASYGFNVGDTVERKADKSKGEIISADKQLVRLRIAGDVVAAVPIETFLKRQWSVVAVKTTTVSIQPTVQIQKCTDFVKHRIASFISIELSNLALQHQELLQHTQILVKPKKGVQVTKAFAKGKLLLVPLSLKVMAGETPPKSAIVAPVQAGPLQFWLAPLPAPKNADHIAAPFWFVQHDKEDNMEMFSVKASQASGVDPLTVQIPIARNSKPLVAGDWLIFPQRVEVEHVDPLQPEPAQPVCKRPKKAGKP
jgi:hypothetical protein